MKEITKMSRLTGQLEKCFRMLNEHFFDSVLPTPIITVIPSSRSYAHYTPYTSWNTKDGGKHEINIASGTLDRPFENILASLLHEMCHQWNDQILNVADCSRNGTYHNKYFAKAAREQGLEVYRTEKYGWSRTEPGEPLLDFLLEHCDELKEIEICRINPSASVTVGTHSNNGGLPVIGTNPNSHSRKLQCPCCGNSVRATKTVHIMCIDCMEVMQEI